MVLVDPRATAAWAMCEVTVCSKGPEVPTGPPGVHSTGIQEAWSWDLLDGAASQTPPGPRSGEST